MQTQYITLPNNAKDITDQRFGRLVALGPVERNKWGRFYWLCRCDCGKTRKVVLSSLSCGHTQSCGCLQKERALAATKTHGLTGDPIYAAWVGIVGRCENANHHAFASYGGRGISICSEWLHNVIAFRDHVFQLSHCGENGYTLDRIDNDGDYAPGNVRWATMEEQGNNRRTNRNITYNGQTKTITHWAHSIGIKRSTLYSRLERGWTIERALSKK